MSGGNRKWFFTRLDSIEKLAKSDKNLSQLKLVVETKNFIKRGDFTTRKHSKEVLKFWGIADSVVSRKLKLSETNVRNIRGGMSETLYRLLGEDYLDNLEFGTPESLKYCKCKLEVFSSNKSSIDYFPSEFLDYVKENSIDEEESLGLLDFSVSDCRDEYQFLKRFSLPAFKGELRNLDMSKVAYLIRVLNREAGSIEDTFSFMQRLSELEGV